MFKPMRLVPPLSTRQPHTPHKAEQATGSFQGGEVGPLLFGSNMPAKINAMLVMARERHLPLLNALESCGIEVLPVCDCNEARRMLEAQPVQVVVTDTALPDGDWRRVLEIVARGCENTEVVVSLRLGDHMLWLDVLEQGGYDVLVDPYQRAEVQRIVEAAAAKSSMRSHAQAISHKRKAARGWTG
jgi:DNA-binding NtrC family response regulator